ncbi:MAG: hypothetical protein HY903_04625 [Deltaproteobacteria bacterium]|nr:hypothetical protein [Deltaproteobacteria bacterium]
MPSQPINDIRAGTQLISGLMKEVRDGYSDGNTIAAKDVKAFCRDYSPGTKTFDDTLMKVWKYAYNVNDKADPDIRAVNKALANGMKMIARADNNGNVNQKLDPSEFSDLAATWKAMARFSRQYKDYAVSDIVYPVES